MITASDRVVSTACVRSGHQVAISAVKTSNARPTGTFTVTDSSTTRSLVSCIIRLSFLGGFLEGRECVLPEALEVLAQLGERVAVDAVVMARALGAVADEPGLLEHAEMLRDRGTRDVQATRELDDRLRPAAEP